MTRLSALLLFIAGLAITTHAQPAGPNAERETTPVIGDAGEAMSAALALLESGDAAEALARFEAIAGATPEEPAVRARAHFNAGLAASGMGSVEETIEHFRAVDRVGGEEGLRADARFNTGAALYRAAKAAQESTASGPPAREREDPVEMLRRAAGAYRAVLAIEPGRKEAAKRVEKIRREIREIERRRAEQQRRAEQMREAAEELEKLAQEQQSESDENRENQRRTQQDAERQQDDLSERTESQRKKEAEQSRAGSEQQQRASERAQEQLERAREAQQRAEEALEQDRRQEASRAQQEAAEAMREAAESLREGSEQSQQGQQQPSENEPSEEGEGEPSESESGQEEGERGELAERLLEREKQLREQRERVLRAIRGRPETVERDW